MILYLEEFDPFVKTTTTYADMASRQFWKIARSARVLESFLSPQTARILSGFDDDRKLLKVEGLPNMGLLLTTASLREDRLGGGYRCQLRLDQACILLLSVNGNNNLI